MICLFARKSLVTVCNVNKLTQVCERVCSSVIRLIPIFVLRKYALICNYNMHAVCSEPDANKALLIPAGDSIRDFEQ